MRRSEKGIDLMTNVPQYDPEPSHMDSVATIEAEQNMVADPTLRSIEDIIADLSRPVNPRRLRTRKQGGKQITYLPWYQAVKYLDHYAPGWSYEVQAVTAVGDAVAITVRISIPCAEGIVWREAAGYEPLNVKGYGDPTSNAESMALRRAAAKFGLCLYLYGR
jgi:hypothetical protein